MEPPPPPPAPSRAQMAGNSAADAIAQVPTWADRVEADELAAATAAPVTGAPEAAMEIDEVQPKAGHVKTVAEAYLRIVYDGSIRADMPPMNKAQIGAALRAAADAQDLQIDVDPTHGVGGGGVAGVDFYYETYEMAKEIADAIPTWTDRVGDQDIKYNILCFRCVKPVDAFRPTDDFIGGFTLFANVHLERGWMFSNINKYGVADGFSRMGLTVYRKSRPCVKIEDSDGNKLSLGQEWEGDIVNVTLAPPGAVSDMWKFALAGKFARQVPMQLRGKRFGINYSLGAGKETREEIRTLISCLCPVCHLFTSPDPPRPEGIGKPTMLCDGKCVGKGKGKGKGGPGPRIGERREGKGGPGPAQSKRIREEQAAENEAAFKLLQERSKVARQHDRSGEQCPWYALGKCQFGLGKCKFAHDLEGMPELSTIPCAHEKRGDNKCKYGARCIYKNFIG